MDPLPPEVFLAPYPEPIRAAAERLRSIILRTVPDAIEAVRPDTIIKATPRDLEKSDAVLDAALKFLKTAAARTTAPARAP